MDQRRGHLDPLLIAQGELFDRLGGPFGQAQPLEQHLGVGFGSCRPQAVQAGEVAELFGDFHFRIEPAFLGHVSETAAVGRHERLPVEGHAPAVRGEHAEDDPHSGGFARAVRPDEAGHPARSHRQADVVEHLAAGKRPIDALKFQYFAGGVHSTRLASRIIRRSAPRRSATGRIGSPSGSSALGAGLRVAG